MGLARRKGGRGKTEGGMERNARRRDGVSRDAAASALQNELTADRRANASMVSRSCRGDGPGPGHG